jgi:hypothetical protein
VRSTVLIAALAVLAVPAAAQAADDESKGTPPGVPAPGRECSALEPAPDGYRCAKSSTFRHLLRDGAIGAALGDILLVLTMVGNGGADKYAVLPIVGPFAAAALHRTRPPPSTAGMMSSSPTDPSSAAYVLAGLGQTAGAALMLTSLTVKTRLERKEATVLVPVPLVSPTASGIGLVGTF